MVPAMVPGSPLFALRTRGRCFRSCAAWRCSAHRCSSFPACGFSPSRRLPPPASSRLCSSPRSRSFFSARSVGLRRWLATAVGLLGVLIILRPGSSAFHPAAFFPVVSAFAWACTLIMTRKMSGQRARHRHHDLFVDCGLCGSLRIGSRWSGSRQAGTISCSGLSSAWRRRRGNGSSCWLFATRMLPCWRHFPISSCSGSALLGFMIFGEVPDVWTVVGAAFIVASGLYTAHRERVRHSKLVALAEPSPNP